MKESRIEAPKAPMGWSVGRGIPFPTWDRVWGGGCDPSPGNFWICDIKMVSFCAFWVVLFTV